jgi:hypothetical protein
MKPMRMLILLAVFWAAGSLLLAAESPSVPKPAPAAKSATGESAKTATPKSDAKSGDAKTSAKEEEGKDETKDDSKRSISEQAEAALKAAAEADAAAAKQPPKSADKEAVDETQAPPDGSAGKGPSPQRFVPSEQVRADFDVSFPIDI